MSIPESVLTNLKHQFLVIRKEAIEELVEPLKTDSSNLTTIENFVFTLLGEDTWQSKQSAFLLSHRLMNYSDKKFQDKILEAAKECFEYKEHRVREAVADCMGELARVGGIAIYKSVKKQLFDLIEENFTRPENDASGPQSLAKIEASKKEKENENEKEKEKEKGKENERKDNEMKHENDKQTAQNGNHDHNDKHDHNHHNHDHNDNHNHNHNHNDDDSNDKDEKKEETGKNKVIPKPTSQHDSEGWKCLWSAMKTIERMIVGLDVKFEPEIDEKLLQLLQKATLHINRFVREVTYQTYAAICHSLSKDNLKKMGDELSIVIKAGLGDNWSQVRYAASHAVREFLDTLETMEEQSVYFDRLLPAMCLNRYYVAAGVRVYSLESWKRLVGTEGRNLVAKHIDDVVKYFTMQACADNHAVREAACHCIAELALKVAPINREAVCKHVSVLLDALIACFKDESWPVRDAACTASGDFVSIFPKDVNKEDLKDLYHLWFEHLSDNIPSVRENAAMSLGKVIKAYGKESEKMAENHIKDNLLKVVKQPSDSKKYSEYENTTIFGVAAKRIRDNDATLHSGQQQYSCGSLAPKLKRGTRSGCMDHGFSRDREPWEYTDGAVHLLKELININPMYFETFVAQLSQIASIRHFAHFHLLQQTIWDSMPSIAQAAGKRKFKMYLELLLTPMIETLDCKNRLAENSAAKCVMFCNNFIGSRLFQGRLKPDQIEIIKKSPFVELK